MKIFFTYQEGLLLIKLILSHLLVDFVLQPNIWIKDKKEKQHKSIFLYLQGLLAGILAWFFMYSLDAWWLIIVVGISHTMIDLWKIKKDKNGTAQYFILDQLAHLIILVACWIVFTHNFNKINNLLIYLTSDIKILTVLMAYLLVIFPSGYLIGFFTKKWQENIDHSEDVNSPRTGKYIGWFERSLILTFILLNKYEAIGFLLTAKSLLRFRDTDRKLTEYVLVGTLMSLSITIIIGLLTLFLIKI